MSVDDPVVLVHRAEQLMEQGCWPDAEILLIEAWRLARTTADHSVRGDIAFRIAATYRVHGSFDRARKFDIEAYRSQQLACGLH